MAGFPLLPVPTGHLNTPSRKYYRSISGSPTRQQYYQQHQLDSLVSQLAPNRALQTLLHPTGSIKDCLDTATSSDQSFALRAARASSSIQEWLDEVSQWKWPECGGSAGFEEPISRVSEDGSDLPPSPLPVTANAPPRTPEKQISRSPHQSGVEGNKDRDVWMGSLLASDVARYTDKINEIEHEIEDLEVEDLKRHILHNHILPLSRPGSPLPDASRRRQSVSSYMTFTKMDDLTAVVTSIVLQALPQLSKLVRLLELWKIRLLVLKKIPSLLDTLGGAEAAIKIAWSRLGTRNCGFETDEFSAMKVTLEQEVSKAAQTIDYMLDCLDGCEDLIPERWIDRIDAAEREYGEWVAVCERRIRESEWSKIFTDSRIVLPPALSAPSAPYDSLPVMIDGNAPKSQQITVDTAQGLQDDDNDAADLLPSGFQTPPRALSQRSSFESLRSEPSLPSIEKGTRAEDGFSHVFPPSQVASSDDVMSGRSTINIPDHVDTFSVPPSNLPDFDLTPGYSESRDMDDEQFAGDESVLSSPPDFRSSVRSTVTFNDMPTVTEIPGEESPTDPKTPIELSFALNDGDNDNGNDDLDLLQEQSSPSSRRMSLCSDDDHFQQQISEILESIPAKIHLSSQPSPPLSHLNPPDFRLPRKTKSMADTARSTSSMSSRSGTPSFLLAPAFARNPRPRHQRANQDIKLYHLSRSTGEAPIKLFIRLVGENGERVMVRVGGGWADLSEYLKEYASHHSRRSKTGRESKIEIRDLPPNLTASMNSRAGSSPPSRPSSALDSPMALSPLNVRKTRRSVGEEVGSGSNNGSKTPRTPLSLSTVAKTSDTPSSGTSTRSRSSSHVSWTEEDSSLGMSGPRAKNVEMSEESKAWVESVKEKVRNASGELKVSDQMEGKFGEMGKVGGTKRLFRKT